MKNPEIIFFYSRKKDIPLGRALFKDFKTLFLPATPSFTGDSASMQNAVIVIWDTSKNNKGQQLLERIQKEFSDVPVFLLAENPSRAYLLALIKCKKAQFFPLPVDKALLLPAIEETQQYQRSGWFSRFRSWLIHMPSRVRGLLHPVRKKTPQREDAVENLEFLGLIPPKFRKFLGKEPEQQIQADLYVQFFGSLKITIRGRPVPHIKGKKNALVLAYLCYHHHKSVHRDVLIDRFWNNYNTASAKNSLNVAICSIRKDLARVLKDQEVILYENESYCINPQLEIVTDVEKFNYLWNKGQAIEATQGLDSALHAYNRAVALYQKEFLENLRFEEWCESERANLQEIYLFILNRLSAYFFQQENYYSCITICNKMLSTDRCLEEVYRKLMKCYYALGSTDMAFRQYFKCKKVLKEELDLAPSKPTEELLEGMQSGQII